MGGTIRVIHVIDKQIDKQSRWTNSLPEYVKTDKFISGDRKWINDYLTRKSAYREDDESFSPNGYGLDVFDFDKREIHTCQGYCSYSEISYATVWLWLDGGILESIEKKENGKTITVLSVVTSEDPNFYPPIVERMWDSGMVSVILENSRIIKSKEELDNISFLQVLQEMKKYDRNKFVSSAMKRGYDTGLKSLKKSKINSSSFYVEWKKMGWKLMQYSEDKKGWTEFYENMKNNYPLTDEEKKLWEEKIEEAWDGKNVEHEANN